MIRINNIKLKLDYQEKDIISAIRKSLKISYTPRYEMAKLSLDDRKPNQVKYIASVDVFVENERKILNKVNNNNVMSTKAVKYVFPVNKDVEPKYRPVVIGTGPAGLFCALYLARAGYRPIIFERGMDVDRRKAQIESYWKGESELNPNCNVQFGEGGAGTFSDGKLNTVIKDNSGRRTQVLKTFVEHGADSSIIYINKPHLGTDVLSAIVKSIREEIISLGGEVHFESLFVGYEAPTVQNDEQLAQNNEQPTRNNTTNSRQALQIGTCEDEQYKKFGTVDVHIKNLRNSQVTSYRTDALILALGHSSRDTITMLYEKGLPMTQKPFAMGLRIEHERESIDVMKYGDKPEYKKLLPAADYKMTHQASNGRSVYSFCMCPGGYVVNSSSEPYEMCVNGMSYSGRDGKNSNSAIVVNVTPEDFGSEHPLAGMEFQRKWEKAAYEAGEGAVPVQLFGDFVRGVPSTKLGHISPSIKGKYKLTNLKCCLPEYINNAIIDGVVSFNKRMPGYLDDDALLSGIESRTSSPVKIERQEDYRCKLGCIYPCGEGAGYAGGITSAAVDGIKVAEAVALYYAENHSDDK